MVSTSQTETTIEIHHNNYPDPIRLNFFWLRDHCRCSKCYSTDTHQRTINFLDIPFDIKPKSCEIIDKNLFIEWDDGHESNYDFNFLYNSKYENNNKIQLDESPVLWNKNQVYDLNYARVNLNDYICDEEIAKNVLRSLIKYGVAFIEKVPPNVQITEIAVKRLFSIQKTFFGEMYVLADTKEHSDSAYSKGYLGAHTDNTYFNDPAGLQIFHCIEHNGTGGETLLVDGFKIINDLKNKHFSTYERLCKIPVPAEYIEQGQHHKYCAPLINRNLITGNPEQIRFNVYDRSCFNTIPNEKMLQFYSDFRQLATEIQSPVNEWWFKLNPGTVMFCDNWRVLHGRAQYTGKRVIVGCYVTRTDFLSSARRMNIIR